MIKGSVQQMSERVTRGGTMYSIKVANEWYGMGKSKPTCKEGDVVEFQEFKNDKGYWSVTENTLHVVADLAHAPKETGGTPNDRQVSIQWQSARRDAIAIVDIAQRLGITLPIAAAAKGKGKDNQVDSLILCIDMVAEQLMRTSFDTDYLNSLTVSEDLNPNPSASTGDSFSE